MCECIWYVYVSVCMVYVWCVCESVYGMWVCKCVWCVCVSVGGVYVRMCVSVYDVYVVCVSMCICAVCV